MKHKVLVVSLNDKAFDFVKMANDGRYFLNFANDFVEELPDCEMIIADVPQGSKSWLKRLYEYSDNGYLVVALLSETYFDQLVEEAVDRGVAVLKKPLALESFSSHLMIFEAFLNRLNKLKKRNESLKNRLSDVSLVNRAKWLLIESANMSEQEAHHFIEKSAMDMGLSIREVASNIIRTYNR